MKVHVKFFAILRERAGTSQVELDLSERATVAEASGELSRTIPAIEPFLARVAFAVNQNYVDRAAVLHDGDELALIPPVSGG